MIRRLAQTHEVTVATVARDRRELADGEPLRAHCSTLHVEVIPAVVGWSRFGLATFSPVPATFAYFYSRRLARRITGLLARGDFDAILVHSSSMGPYVARHRGCWKVMDFGDADSEKWLEYARDAPFPVSLGFRLESVKVRRYERWLAGCFDAGSVISEAERAVLAPIVGRELEVIPNGVDLEYFHPAEPGARPYRPRRLVFTGNMSYRPNVDAAVHLVSDILPRIRTVLPGVELYVVGMDPSPAVRRLADGDRIVVTGRVDDVRPYLGEAAVAVAPLRVARGLQNKVLEAMAMRVPVVASPAAARGTSALPGRDLAVAADADGFAGSVLELLQDRTARERCASAGRAYVEEHHNWDRLLQRLEDLVNRPVPTDRR
jgi:sugar transferase (PEP-CTERM/EpsH1 system associated)